MRHEEADRLRYNAPDASDDSETGEEADTP